MEYHITSARIRFGLPREGRGKKAEEVVFSLLGALTENGQIGSDTVESWSERSIDSYVSLLRPDALSRRHVSPWGVKVLDQAQEVFSRRPAWELLEPPPRVRYPDWKRARILYLATDMFERHSPVRVPGTGEPIPLYLLPIPYQERGYLCDWSGQYRACDALWIGSGALEIAAYRQLAEPGSDLSIQGRRFCSLIELATGKRVYYHLKRSIGHLVEDEHRPCPGCGGKWALPRPKKMKHYEIRMIGFLCRRCRLVSNDWPGGEGGRHARIGEWRGRRIPRPRAKAKDLIPPW